MRISLQTRSLAGSTVRLPRDLPLFPGDLNGIAGGEAGDPKPLKSPVATGDLTANRLFYLSTV